MQKHLAILLCALALCHTAHVHAAILPTLIINESHDCAQSRTTLDLNACLYSQGERLRELKTIHLNQIRHHLRHRPHIWRLLQQEENAWQRHSDIMSQMAYESFERGSGRDAGMLNMQNMFLITRIQALQYLLEHHLNQRVVKLAYPLEDSATETESLKIHDLRCTDKTNWYVCTREQRRQLNPLLNSYRRTSLQTINYLPRNRYRREQQYRQAYRRAARNFGTAMWHNRYAGQTWENFSIKTNIYAFNHLLFSDDYLPTPIIKLD